MESTCLIDILAAEPEEKDAPFRFSTTSLSPEPAQNVNFTPGSASNSVRKMLSKNPNGSYVLRGGGSARPRNRYHSPGFGPPQRMTTPIRINPEKPPADGKRRRIGYDPDLRSASSNATTNGTPTTKSSPATNGTPTPAGPTSPSPITGPSAAHAVPRAGAPPPSTPIRHRSVLPTTPVNPSPLRQAWGQSDSPPSRSSPPSAGKQTQSAAYLSQLIKDISPKKNLDIQNPYQAANVLPPRPATKKPQQRRRTQPVKAEAKPPTEQPKSKSPHAAEPAITSIDVIAATMPTVGSYIFRWCPVFTFSLQGSKRARPSPDDRPILNGNLAVSPSKGSSTLTTGPSIPRGVGRSGGKIGPILNGAISKSTVVIHEISDDDDDESPQKKQKTKNTPMPATNGHSRPKRPSVEIEDVPDVAMSSKPQTYTLPSEVIEPGEGSKSTARGVSPTSTSAPLAPFRVAPGSGQDRFRKFAPARPSSLRNQVSVDKEDAPEPMAPPPAPKLSFAPAPKLSAPPAAAAAKPVVQQNKPAVATTPKDAKAIVLAKSVRELPTFTLTITATRLEISQLAKDKAKALPQATLPPYDLKALSSPGAGPSSLTSKAPTTSSASKSFNWAAAGIAKPTPRPEGSWTCSTCMCANDAKTTEKCAICEAPRPGAAKALAVEFDWSAAGIAKPKAKEGSWMCSTCMCSNGADVIEKCTVCETARPR